MQQKRKDYEREENKKKKQELKLKELELKAIKKANKKACYLCDVTGSWKKKTNRIGWTALNVMFGVVLIFYVDYMDNSLLISLLSL